VRHAFAPDSILLGSFTYQDAIFSLRDEQPGEPGVTSIDLRRPERAYSAELQHLFRSRYVNLTSGAGYFDINGRIDSTVGEVSESISTDLKHTNVYAYSYINLLKDVTFTAGFSADFLSGDSPDVGDKDQFNPKFGITWNPFRDTTVRAAVFRILKRTLITDQTLEPTQVAGFNQFFDDVNGTQAWRYGGAIDQKFTKDIFAGVEFSKRDLKLRGIEATSDPDNPITRQFNQHEYLARAYLFWTPHAWLALRAAYIFERFNLEGLTDQTKLNTHRVPLGISFFHPSGLTASLTATYFNQDVKLEDSRSGRDDFWIVDAAIRYRLPKRYGFITVGATNIFDTKFKFFDLDFQNASIQPNRIFFARVTLALP
jgi:hypothetical protein